jgi:vacuolar-type H+-ATPase subunit C/Vma6
MKSERAYVYAKASGMIAKSFVKDRVERLSGITSLETLEDMLFGVVDTSEDIEGIEKRLERREREAIAKILKAFYSPPRLLCVLAESDRFAQPSGRVNSDAAPDAPDIDEVARQNRAYYFLLWEELQKTPLSDRALIAAIITDEIRLKNAVWALRLRVYYEMDTERIKTFLIDIKPKKGRSLYAEAVQSLSLDIEEEAQWHSWQLWKYANRPVSGQYWKIAPRFFQNKASLHLYRLAQKSFHSRPFSLDSACCFIKLKQFEREILSSVAEAARLGFSGADALATLGLSAKAV